MQGRKIASHDFATHLMLKIREPVTRFGGSGAGSARSILHSALAEAKKFFNDASGAGAHADVAKEEKKDFKLENGPGKDEQTLVLDVDLPYGLLNGDHEISIPLKLGKNHQGETFILGVSESIKEALKIPTQAAQSTTIPIVVKEEKLETVIPKVKQEKAEEMTAGESLNATWLADVTFPDDSFVAPATEFNKIWRVQNTGRTSWPEGTQLVCVSGFGKNSSARVGVASYDVAQAASGEQVLVTARDIVAPETSGKHTSYYRFVTPDGQVLPTFPLPDAILTMLDFAELASETDFGLLSMSRKWTGPYTARAKPPPTSHSIAVASSHQL